MKVEEAKSQPSMSIETRASVGPALRNGSTSYSCDHALSKAWAAPRSMKLRVSTRIGISRFWLDQCRARNAEPYGRDIISSFSERQEA